MAQIDAAMGWQEVYVKPVESLLAHSGNITRDELRRQIRQELEEFEERKRRDKAKRKELRRGFHLM